LTHEFIFNKRNLLRSFLCIDRKIERRTIYLLITMLHNNSSGIFIYFHKKQGTVDENRYKNYLSGQNDANIM